MKIRSLFVADKKIVFSTLVQYVGKIILLFLSIVTLKLIAKALVPYDYGIYAGISEYALFFSVVANLGIFAHVVRKMSDAPRDGQTFFEALVLRVVTALLLFIAGVLIAVFIGYDHIFILSLLLYFVALLGDYITSVCDAFLQANYQMGRATLALLMGKLAYTGALYLMVNQVEEVNLIGVFALTIIASIITAGLSLYFVVRQIRWQWRVNWAEMAIILRLSIPFGLITICNSIYFRFLPDYMASVVLTSEQFATFSIAFKIAQVVSLFSTFLMFSALPSLRQYLDARAWPQVRKLYRQLVGVMVSLGIILVTVGTMFAPVLITLLADKKYVIAEFWFLLPLMLLLAAISYGYDLVLITLFVFNEERWFLKKEIVTLLLAAAISMLAWVMDTDVQKMLIIISGAIIAETYIVYVGQRKIRQIMQKSLT